MKPLICEILHTSWRGNPFLHAIYIFLAPQYCVSLRRVLDNIGVVLAAKRALTGPICDLSRLILTVNLEAYGVRLPKRAAETTPPRHYGSISIIVKDSHVVDVKSTIPSEIKKLKAASLVVLPVVRSRSSTAHVRLQFYLPATQSTHQDLEIASSTLPPSWEVVKII
ncbi:MAG: hypothetical protein L6R42_007795, partial [Xanthoria sp. 1 TBL-2021]